MFEQDYIMRLIKEMVRTILKLLFNIDTENPTAELLDEQEYQNALEGLYDLIDAGNIDEAENQIYELASGEDMRKFEMPNGTETLSIYSENDIETYRDVLYYVAQVLGGFCVINREGKLELRKYSADSVLTVEQKHRFPSSFSDFVTRYTAVSSTNMRTQTAEYYALETDDGLTMNLGVNPLLQFGLEETREALCTNILNDLSVINYVPFDSDTIGNPALDLGDVLTFEGGQADGTKLACITSMTIRIGGRQSLKCVGKNPRLARA